MNLDYLETIGNLQTTLDRFQNENQMLLMDLEACLRENILLRYQMERYQQVTAMHQTSIMRSLLQEAATGRNERTTARG